MATPHDGATVHIPSADPADILLDADGLAGRYGICVDVARRLLEVTGFPSISVSDRRRLVPLVALRHWELVTSMPSIIALLEPPSTPEGPLTCPLRDDQMREVTSAERNNGKATSEEFSSGEYKGVPAVRNTVAVLRFLHERQNEPATMSQVARALRMNGSTCFNLLKTMEYERLLAYDDVTKTYSLGLHLVELASVVDHQGRIVEAALKQARPLVAQMELACLIVRHTADDEFLVVDKVESPRPIKVTVAVGQRFPANSAVLAKAYYAFQEEAEVEAMLAQHGLPAYSERSITDAAEFREHLELVRRDGFAQSHGEYWRDHHALAAPIFGSDGRVAFLLLTVGFTFELPPEVMQSHGRLLREAADRVTAEIGGRHPGNPRAAAQI